MPQSDPALDDQHHRAIYAERALLAALLAGVMRAFAQDVVRYSDPDETSVCTTVVKAETPEGQVSWHVHPADLQLFEWVPIVDASDPRAAWDQHTSEDKNQRLRRLLHRVLSRGPFCCAALTTAAQAASGNSPIGSVPTLTESCTCRTDNTSRSHSR